MSFKKMLLVGMVAIFVGAQCSGAAFRQASRLGFSRLISQGSNYINLKKALPVGMLITGIGASQCSGVIRAEGEPNSCVNRSVEPSVFEAIGRDMREAKRLLNQKAYPAAIHHTNSKADREQQQAYVNAVLTFLATKARCLAFLAESSCVDEINVHSGIALPSGASEDDLEMLELKKSVALSYLTEDFFKKLNNQWHKTILQVASFNGQAQAVSVFLTAKAQVDEESCDGETALHRAVEGRQAAVVELLLDNRASTAVAERFFGWTPLHYAARIGHADITSRLLAKEACLKIRDKTGCTALDLAAKSFHHSVVSVIIDVSRHNIIKQCQTIECAVQLNGDFIKSIESALQKAKCGHANEREEKAKRETVELLEKEVAAAKIYDIDEFKRLSNKFKFCYRRYDGQEKRWNWKLRTEYEPGDISRMCD